MKRAVFSPLADIDLEEIGLSIGWDNPTRADEFVDELKTLSERIAESPGIGRRRPELASEVRSFPYRNDLLFYRVNDGASRSCACFMRRAMSRRCFALRGERFGRYSAISWSLRRAELRPCAPRSRSARRPS